ncbi:MAG TPA: hypothetical protein VFT71_08630 [Candidatus Nitrosocosmicus sp.]|nr:hypothetical protein [Candidatus Nitrosocosmicus sp.]
MNTNKWIEQFTVVSNYVQEQVMEKISIPAIKSRFMVFLKIDVLPL